MNDRMASITAGIQSIEEALANPTNQNPSYAQNPVPSQDGDVTQHRRSNPGHVHHPARGHNKWTIKDDMSQGHDTDNWSRHVHLDLSLDYITVLCHPLPCSLVIKSYGYMSTTYFWLWKSKKSLHQACGVANPSIMQRLVITKDHMTSLMIIYPYHVTIIMRLTLKDYLSSPWIDCAYLIHLIHKPCRMPRSVSSRNGDRCVLPTSESPLLLLLWKMNSWWMILLQVLSNFMRSSKSSFRWQTRKMWTSFLN